MKIFNFYLSVLTVGIFFVSGEKDSSDNESSSKAPNDKTKNESDSKSTEKKVNYNQGFLVTPDERLLISQRLFQTHKPGFLENNGYIPVVRIPIGGKRQDVHLTDDTGRYNVQLENFQHERPTPFQAALGAISAHIINQKNEEYIPYPPNGNPYNYPAYRGHPHATEPPVIKAYERSSSSNYDAPPLADFNQQNPRRAFPNNIYQRSFPEIENFEAGFYPGNFFNNGAPEQVRNSQQINRWYEDQRGEYRGPERIF